MVNEDIYIRSLTPSDLNEMYFAFLDAFSDYTVPFRINKEQFVRKFVEKLKIEYRFSLGAFDYEALAGFLFTSIANYNNTLTAYNGGTGVRPAFRGLGITQKLYDHLLPKLKTFGVKQSILEVLVDNQNAINVYKSIGFEEIDLLHSYTLNKRTQKLNILSISARVEIAPVNKPSWERYQELMEFSPSFLDCIEMIEKNIANERILEARVEGKIVGYAVYQSILGRISQLGIDKEYRGRKIGTALVKYIYEKSNANMISAINIRNADTNTQKFFASLGFELKISQYEMRLPIK